MPENVIMSASSLAIGCSTGSLNLGTRGLVVKGKSVISFFVKKTNNSFALHHQSSGAQVQ